MAKAVKIKELPELGLTEPQLLHVQESYLRQVTHSLPRTAKKKSKSEVRATSAKWYRQKGTGRARQGERTNPHLVGGGLAFPPQPHRVRKRLNKRVRRGALHSAVLLHVQRSSAHVIQGAEFDQLSKTRDVAAVLEKVTSFEPIMLVLQRQAPVWRAARNIWNVRLMAPQEVNVRDLVECAHLVFTEDALSTFREILKGHLAESEVPAGEDGAEEAAAAPESEEGEA